MKTSNKLMLIAIIIILISMVAYDFALRAEYRKGEFRKPFYGMEKDTTLSGFTTIENRTANYVSVNIEQGKTAEIYTRHDWKKDFKVYKNGSILVIDVNEKAAKNLNPYHQNSITIICPSIEKLITKPYLQSKSSENFVIEGTTMIQGFNLQNLLLNIGNQSFVVLNRNKIDQLQAIIGDNSSRKSNLTINSDNQINTAKIDVLGKNLLNVENPTINTTNFTISDSATVSASGRFLKQFKK
ncbi:MAG: hypothetical protein EOP42_14845 [Sphingobacteriaceae bacterium]|nr:MAG: hypothetical protein EOP42_14845 [Sphingobacteriaceae bacterium]